MKNSRKRLLISSVSMLLVAVLSLSIATYAWFSNKAYAGAEGINFSAGKDSPLVLSFEKDEPEARWASTLSLDVEKLDLKPVSTVNCVDWFTTHARSVDTVSTAERGRATVEKVTDDNKADYYVARDFYIKSIYGSDINVTFSVNVEPIDYNDDSQLSHLRIALAEYNSSGTPVIKRVYGDNYAHNKGIKSVSSDGTVTTATVRITDYLSGSLKLSPNEPKKLTLFVWYEGEDPDCIDSKSGVKAVIDVAFTKASSGGVIS